MGWPKTWTAWWPVGVVAVFGVILLGCWHNQIAVILSATCAFAWPVAIALIILILIIGLYRSSTNVNKRLILKRMLKVAIWAGRVVAVFGLFALWENGGREQFWRFWELVSPGFAPQERQNAIDPVGTEVRAAPADSTASASSLGTPSMSQVVLLCTAVIWVVLRGVAALARFLLRLCKVMGARAVADETANFVENEAGRLPEGRPKSDLDAGGKKRVAAYLELHAAELIEYGHLAPRCRQRFGSDQGTEAMKAAHAFEKVIPLAVTNALYAELAKWWER
jgi:hypothetical protein